MYVCGVEVCTLAVIWLNGKAKESFGCKKYLYLEKNMLPEFTR